MRFILLLSALALASVLLATPMPTAHLLRGQIVNASSNAPLEYATISAFLEDSTLVDGTITDAQGLFRLRLQTGAYRIRIDFIGYEAQEQQIYLEKDLDLGLINLGADAVALETVEVTAEKSQFNLQLDKKIFNVGQDLTSRGGSATEVLENVPAVSVEADGTISLRGNTGVTILVNGRPSSLADNNALAAIPAASIERVEVITNPSARYEAAGNAGIINIVLKKNQAFGFNGTLTLTAGSPADYQPLFNFNLRKNNWNIYGNLGARYANFEGRGSVDRENILPNLPTFIEQGFRQDRNDKAAFGFIGIDYNITDYQSLTASYSHYGVVNTDQTRRQLNNLDSERNLTNQWQQILDYREPESYNQIDLAYTKTYEQEGKKWSITLQHDFWYNEEIENIQLNQVLPTPEALLRLRTSTDESSLDYLVQTDYITKLNANTTLEMGLRGESRVIVSDYIAENDEDGTFTVFRGLDNRLDYFERIGGAYVQIGQKLAKFNYLLGLRSEYTFVRVENTNSPEVIDKRYVQLFPTANFSYELTEEARVQLSYSRRIRRPAFWQLNPFGGLQDPNEVFQGNPDLDPAYTDRVELTYLRNWKRLTLNPSVYFSTTTDYFEFIYSQQADGLAIERPVNLDRENNLGLELTLTYRPTDWLDWYGELNYFGFRQRGEFGDLNFDFQDDTWTAGTRLQVNTKSGWFLQGSLNYRAARSDALTTNRSVYFADFALAKRLFNDRLTVTINLRNAFDTRVFRGSTEQPTFRQEIARAGNTRRYGLNLTYRIQKGKKLSLRSARGSIR